MNHDLFGLVRDLDRGFAFRTRATFSCELIVDRKTSEAAWAGYIDWHLKDQV
jgi:hypothetical protein